MSARVLNADCLAALRDMPDASVDAVVTDPPYGILTDLEGWQGDSRLLTTPRRSWCGCQVVMHARR